jgi:hypothetical protein
LCKMMHHLWGINLLHEQPFHHRWFSMIGLDCTSKFEKVIIISYVISTTFSFNYVNVKRRPIICIFFIYKANASCFSLCKTFTITKIKL